jgi:hypothetical protein
MATPAVFDDWRPDRHSHNYVVVMGGSPLRFFRHVRSRGRNFMKRIINMTINNLICNALITDLG